MLPIGQLRWNPIPIPDEPLDFLTGLRTIASCGDVFCQLGMASHVYVATRSMDNKYFYDADGELLIVPQVNGLRLRTECGVIEVIPGEICLVPRGLKFAVDLMADNARGYVCENYGSYFELPERGPIGANCLANARDFLYPHAAYEDVETPCELYVKSGGRLYRTEIGHSPLDVVAWHGNYAPCKYDLRRFSPVGATLFDHPDPSIYTVLSSASERPGTANVDFVIFPERWLVMEDSFRPPWYHMNVMSEFMGLIYGVYDAKPRRLRARRHEPAQCPDRARTGHRGVRRRLHSLAQAAETFGHDGLHVRDPLSAEPDRLCVEPATARSALSRLLERIEEELRSQSEGLVGHDEGAQKRGLQHAPEPEAALCPRV